MEFSLGIGSMNLRYIQSAPMHAVCCRLLRHEDAFPCGARRNGTAAPLFLLAALFRQAPTLHLIAPPLLLAWLFLLAGRKELTQESLPLAVLFLLTPDQKEFAQESLQCSRLTVEVGCELPKQSVLH